MSVKRYTITSSLYHPDTGPLLRSRVDVAETDNGFWVRHQDHAAEVERLHFLIGVLARDNRDKANMIRELLDGIEMLQEELAGEDW